MSISGNRLARYVTDHLDKQNGVFSCPHNYQTKLILQSQDFPS